jgi:glyoxylase-like metal-dependent hydrolase (beta-lactamase superfamily II)
MTGHPLLTLRWFVMVLLGTKIRGLVALASPHRVGNHARRMWRQDEHARAVATTSPATTTAAADREWKREWKKVVPGGDCESPHDPWIVGDDVTTVFLGDQIYDHKYCYLADGFYAEWLANIETLHTRFPEDAVFYIGHGGPVGPEMWDWQRGHVELFIEAVSNAD